jgi:hypothetical protein
MEMVIVDPVGAGDGRILIALWDSDRIGCKGM